jgi:membrane-associated phospholipid phosphatase
MEAEVLLAIHSHASPLLDRLFIVSHQLGTLWFLGPLVLAVALWHGKRGETREGWIWILAGVSTVLIQDIVKILVARPRPGLWPRLVPEAWFSFPSGHALASATLYPLLAWDLTRTQRPAVRAFALAAGVALSLFIGFGRLYLGVHWPTDVAAGWAIGALQAMLAIRQLRCYAAARSS